MPHSIRVWETSRARRRREHDQSGRAMARTGLRMMPTSPSPSLRFRTAGFPRYGFVPLELQRVGVLEFREVHCKPYRIVYEVARVYAHAILDGRRGPAGAPGSPPAA